MDQLPRLGKRELICLLLFACNYVVSVWRGFLFLWVLGMGYVILLWHSLSLHIIILLFKELPPSESVFSIYERLDQPAHLYHQLYVHCINTSSVGIVVVKSVASITVCGSPCDLALLIALRKHTHAIYSNSSWL